MEVPSGYRRVLLYFPIIHTAADMGTLSTKAQNAAIRRFGRVGWKRNIQTIDRSWSAIEHKISDLNLQYNKVRVYQDGLPVCLKEIEIVTKLANEGNRNHLLLQYLMNQGATIMGTESPALLIEEYQLVKKMLAANGSPVLSKLENQQKNLSASLLKKRDLYVASRINETLREGETGILLMGMLHSVSNNINPDICVIYPLNKPIDHTSKQ